MNNYEIAAERVDRKIKFYRNFVCYIIVFYENNITYNLQTLLS